MALQTSGPISLGNIQTEFGGTNPINLSEYYYNGTYVKTTNNNKIPSMGINKLSNYYGAAAFIHWDTGIFNVSTTGITITAIPMQSTIKTTDTFMTAHSGGWGASAEVGKLYWTSNNATTPTKIITLSEGSDDLIPTGKTLYSVSNTGVETATTFGNQSQTRHMTYIEIVGVDNLKYFYSDGAGGNPDNPTSFRNARLYTNYNRASILASLGTNDRYFCIK